MSNIRANLSQYYPMKALFERILGRSSFINVKDYGSLSAWKKECKNLLKAIEVSVIATVEIADDDWHLQVQELLKHGCARIELAKSIDEVFAALAATLGELAFLQLGFVPQGHYLEMRIPLRKNNWKLDPVRTVQYVQSNQQRATQERMKKLKDGNAKAK